ncbi:MAG: HD domain-containing protein [Bacteriovoracaceae bacterium]|nr:HD domain-containing protein [Bacteriovoracaceae bacterium]
MDIRDPVHGSIHILDEEVPIIQHPFFQRLRNIKQLGFCENPFPGSTHTRFLHSIGVMHIGTIVFDKIFRHYMEEQKIKLLKQTFRMACLLHDVGHAPLSHSTEIVMPELSKLSIPGTYLSKTDKKNDRQANHEDYTIKAIVDSSFSEAFNKLERKSGIEKKYIADLIVGKTKEPSYFTFRGINYFPMLHQLISGELDCDRMDYLLRDSYFCGVSYGNYDLDWLIDNLEPCMIDEKAFLGLSERAIVTFDDFLLSRYHMFLMVYFHYKAVCLEQLLVKFFQTSPEEYVIPADIEKYIDHDDYYLMKILRNSSNTHARNLVKNRIPLKIFESFNEDQLIKLESIQNYMEEEGIEYIRCSSSKRISKYHSENTDTPKYSVKVVRKLHETDQKSFSDINEATDLFSKFSNAHAVNRLHCNLDILATPQKNRIIDLINTGPQPRFNNI